MLCTVFITFKLLEKSHNNKVWKLTACSLYTMLAFEQMKHIGTGIH
jgi:hypothetical protein